MERESIMVVGYLLDTGEGKKIVTLDKKMIAGGGYTDSDFTEVTLLLQVDLLEEYLKEE